MGKNKQTSILTTFKLSTSIRKYIIKQRPLKKGNKKGKNKIKEDDKFIS